MQDTDFMVAVHESYNDLPEVLFDRYGSELLSIDHLLKSSLRAIISNQVYLVLPFLDFGIDDLF